MELDLNSLNDNQRLAVLWERGPLMVLAGPGSGKTRVLTYRVARLLLESPNERYRILGITFTNTAAAEMRNRVDSLVSEGRDRALLTTFHSFAAEILRQHGSHIGLRPDFAILSQEADREAVISEVLATLGERDETGLYRPDKLLPVINRLLSECVVPEEAAMVLGGNGHAQYLAEVYRQYFQRLISQSQLDFGSLLVLAVQLLETKPAIARQIQRIYRHVCVDEFHDTNGAQYALLMRIVPREDPNLFVVADDDQMIYQWNGANPERLRQISKHFSMKTIQLPENYRCPSEVIDLANRLIKHNDDRASGKKDLVARRPASSYRVIHLQCLADLDEEVRWIKDHILARPVGERAQCTILARTRRLLEAVANELESNGLPAYIAARKTEFQSAPLRWLHTILRLANSRQDREQVRRLCKAFYSLEGVNLRVEDVLSQSIVHEGDYLRTWLNVAISHAGVERHTKAFLTRAVKTLLERLDHWSFIDDAFQWFVALRSQDDDVNDENSDEFESEVDTWMRLQREITQELGKSEVTLHVLLQGMDLRSKEPPPADEAIRCFTIHSAKGMEFRHVYLMGLAEDQLPSWAAIKKGTGSLEMREERRNCFVAITRTELTLTMTYAQRYFGWPKGPSRFLEEMGLVTS